MSSQPSPRERAITLLTQELADATLEWSHGDPIGERLAKSPILSAAHLTLYGGRLRGMGQALFGLFSSGGSRDTAEAVLDRLTDTLESQQAQIAPAMLWSAAIVMAWADEARNAAREAAAFERTEATTVADDLAHLVDLLSLTGPDVDVAQLVARGTGGWITADLAPYFGPEVTDANRPPFGDSLFFKTSSVVELVGRAKPARRELLGAILDVLVQREQSQYSGEFATPTQIARLLAALAAPKAGERVLDPACGQGNILAACIDRTPEATVLGADTDPQALLVAAARVVLAGGDPSGLDQDDALAPSDPAEVDVVVVDPPFGVRLPTPHDGPLATTTDGDVAFLQAALARLKPQGRAVIVVPVGLLGSPRAEGARRTLLEGFAVDAVLALGKTSQSVDRAVLCLTRRDPLDDVWFVSESVASDRALASPDALDVLAAGVAARRGEGGAAYLRSWADRFAAERDAEIDADLFSPDRLDTDAVRPVRDDADDRAARLHVATVVADALLPEGWYDETFHLRPAAGVSWKEPVSWLLGHGASLAVRQTGTRELDEFLDSALAAADGADVQPLASVAAVARGTRVKSDALTDSSTATGPLYVRVGDVQEGRINRPPRRLAGKPGDARRLQTGDVVVTLSGSVARVARVPAELEGAVPSADLAVVAPISGLSLQPGYLTSLLWTVPYQRWLHGHATGTTIQHLRIEELKALPILVLNPDDQRDLAAALRPGDHAGRLLALVSEQDDNPFAVAIANHGPLIEIADHGPDHLQSVSQDLRESLWTLGVDTGALVASHAIDRETGQTAAATYSGRADDPYAEWLWHALSAFGTLATVEDHYGGAERLVVVDRVAARLRRAHDLLRAGVTEADLAHGESGEIQYVDGLLFPAPVRRGSDSPPSGAGRRALDRAAAVLAYVESARDAFKAWLLSPPDAPFSVRVEPDVIELGRPTDLLVTVTNAHPATVHSVRATCLAPRQGDGPWPLEFDGGERDAAELFSEGFLPQDWSKDGVLRLPALKRTGPHSLDIEISYVHLDGDTYLDRVVAPVSVQSVRASAGAAEIGTSPYVVGDPVYSPDLFFGRRGALERIYEQVDRPGQTNLVLLEGTRRSGKSSVLAQLANDENGRLGGWVVVHASLQEGKGDPYLEGLPTVEVFYRIAKAVAVAAIEAGFPIRLPNPDTGHEIVATRVRRSLRPFFDEAGDDAADGLRELLSDWLNTLGDTRLLLLLDEFDKIDEGIESGVTSPRVPENLRALFQQERRVSAVLAVFPRVTRMRQSYWSALFGLGVKVQLEPLAPDEALSLVLDPVRGRLDYRGEAAHYLVGLCGRQPFLIQTLADQVFTSRAAEGRRDVGVDAVEAAARAFASNSEHFSGLWDVVRLARRQLLLALVHRLDGGATPVTIGVLDDALEAEGVSLPQAEELGRDHVAALRELGLVDMQGEEETATYRPTTRLMGRWIDTNVDLNDLRSRAQSEVSL